MKWEEFKHNHYTRDIRPHDCPKCRIQQLEANIKELEKTAESWMNDYQALKDKYEPETVEPAECYGLEETFRRAEVGWIKDGDEPTSHETPLRNAVTTDYEEAQRIDNEKGAIHYSSPRRVEHVSLEEFHRLLEEGRKRPGEKIFKKLTKILIDQMKGK